MAQQRAQALPQAENAHRVAVERVTALGKQRQDAGFRAAAESATSYAEGPCLAALNAYLRHKARLRSIEQALREHGRGNDPSTVALGCANQIGERIAAIKRSAGVRHDITAGPALIDALMADASATLGDKDSMG
jgi:hypothetical protein